MERASTTVIEREVRKRGSTDWPLWVLFALAAALLWKSYGGLSGGIGRGLALSIIPLLPGLAVLICLDRLPSLGVRTWIRAIGWGLLVVPPIAANTHLMVGVVIEGMVVRSGHFEPGMDKAFGSIAGSVLSAPIVEEGLKGLLLLLLLCRRGHPLTGPWQGIVVMSLVALAFGCFENAVKIASALRSPGAPGAVESVGQLRSLFPYLHVVFSLPMGFAIGFAAFLPTLSRRLAAISIGLVVSISLHGLWNWEVLLGKTEYSIFPSFYYLAPLSPLLAGMVWIVGYVAERHSLRKFGALPGGLFRRVGPDQAAGLREAEQLRLSRYLGPMPDAPAGSVQVTPPGSSGILSV